MARSSRNSSEAALQTTSVARDSQTLEESSMSKRLVVSIAAILAAGMFSPLLRAQDEKWNRIPPKRATYNGKKPDGPAPRRDLTGIWDAAQTLGVSGATEYPAL